MKFDNHFRVLITSMDVIHVSIYLIQGHLQIIVIEEVRLDLLEPRGIKET